MQYKCKRPTRGMAYWEEIDGDNINGKHFESQNTNYVAYNLFI